MDGCFPEIGIDCQVAVQKRGFQIPNAMAWWIPVQISIGQCRLNNKLVGGFTPSEKYESQLGWLFPIYWKIKNVPNHQPVW